MIRRSSTFVTLSRFGKPCVCAGFLFIRLEDDKIQSALFSGMSKTRERLEFRALSRRRQWRIPNQLVVRSGSDGSGDVSNSQ